MHKIGVGFATPRKTHCGGTTGTNLEVYGAANGTSDPQKRQKVCEIAGVIPLWITTVRTAVNPHGGWKRITPTG